MRIIQLLAALPSGFVTAQAISNPFESGSLFVSPLYTEKLEETYDALVAQGNTESAAVVRAAQMWAPRAIQESTSEQQVVGLVHYNLPDRDCGGGEAAGEFYSTQGGIERYKNEFVGPFTEKLSTARDIQFALVMEPNSLGNDYEPEYRVCARATPVYEEGLAFAISALQFDNVHL